MPYRKDVHKLHLKSSLYHDQYIMTNAQIQEKWIEKARIFISPKELDDELLREYNEIETVGKLRFSDNLCSARQRRENGLSRQAGNYIIRTGFMK